MLHTIPMARNTCWPLGKSQQVAEGAVTKPPAVSRDDIPVKFNPLKEAPMPLVHAGPAGTLGKD